VAGQGVRFIRRHPFLCFGFFTLGLFFLVAALGAAGQTGLANALAGPMRVLIVPMYLVWMLVTIAHVAIAGPAGLPSPFALLASVIAFTAGFAPYALADYLLNRLRGGSRPPRA